MASADETRKNSSIEAIELVQKNTYIPEVIKSDRFMLFVVIKMVLCGIFWGGTFVAGRIAAPYADPALIAFFRFLLASLFLLAFLFYKHEFQIPSYKQFIGIFFLALTGIFLYNLCFFIGLQTVPANRASLFIANNPLAISVGAAIFLKERLSLIQIFGVILSIIGACIIVSRGEILSLFSSFSTGDLFILGCVGSWTAYSLIGKLVISSLSALVTVTWTCIIGSILFIPLVYNSFSLAQMQSFSYTFWLSIFYLAFFGTVLGFVWFYDAIKYLGAARAGVFINIVPISGVILGALVLNEAITLSIIIGGAFTLTGIYIASKKRK